MADLWLSAHHRPLARGNTFQVNRKHVARLMREMGLAGATPGAPPPDDSTATMATRATRTLVQGVDDCPP